MIPNPHQHGMTRLRRVASACPLTIRFRVRLGAGTPQRVSRTNVLAHGRQT